MSNCDLIDLIYSCMTNFPRTATRSIYVAAKVSLPQTSRIARKVVHIFSWRRGDIVFVFALGKRTLSTWLKPPCLCGQVADREARWGCNLCLLSSYHQGPAEAIKPKKLTYSQAETLELWLLAELASSLSELLFVSWGNDWRHRELEAVFHSWPLASIQVHICTCAQVERQADTWRLPLASAWHMYFLSHSTFTCTSHTHNDKQMF